MSSARARGRSLLRGLSRLLAGVGLLVVLVSATPFTAWYAGKLAGPWNDPKGEVLIVLGGSEAAAGLLGLSSFWRAVYAVRAYQEGGVREVVLSGAGVASQMRDYLVYAGVPPGSIRLEVASRSTRENARFVAPMLAGAPGRKVLLTSDYHMWRACRVFRRLGVEVLPRPIPDAGKRASRWQGRWPAFLDEVVETVKIVYYFARGWM